jgi:DNA ligase 1
MRMLSLSLYCSAMLAVSPAWSVDTLPQIQLAQHYQGALNLAQFWISEKLDGVRVFWDGQQLYSRSGQWLQLPQALMRQLPAFAVDAELWAGRGQFQQVTSLLQRSSMQPAEWQGVRLMVFDAPKQQGTFSERLEFLRQQMSTDAMDQSESFVQLVPQQQVHTEQQLQQWLQQVVAEGGEGLMLHRANALYSAGRVSHLQKLKLAEDAEARVVAHLPGKGQFADVLGALLVELPDGRRFKLGSGFSLAERQNPPAIGSVVTFKYHGLTHKGTPRFAVYLRQRSEY